MAEFSKLLVTDKGSALVMKVLQGNGAIHFTRLAASSRKYQEEYIKELVSLEDIKQHGDISEIGTEDSCSVLLKVVLPNTDLTEGYYIRTIGLYANDPEEGEILYGVSMETSAGGCYVPPYNHQIVSSLYFQVSVAVGNAENVSLEVDAGAVATRRQLDAVQQRITDEVVALHESIERKVEGTTFDSYKNSTDIVLGNTDIAGIGDGTVTGAIRELNTGIMVKTIKPLLDVLTANFVHCTKNGNIVICSMQMELTTEVKGVTRLFLGFPHPIVEYTGIVQFVNLGTAVSYFGYMQGNTMWTGETLPMSSYTVAAVYFCQ